MTLEDLACEAVSRPDSFAYFGDRDLFGSWGFAGIGTNNRDADALTESNHIAIWNDLSERFPDDVEILGSSHWACGWVDQIIVRVYVEDGSITDAFSAVADWHAKLDNYPVADEDDYSAREYDNLIETLTQCFDIPTDDAPAFSSWAEYCFVDELEDGRVSRDWQEYIGEIEAKAIENPNQTSITIGD